MRVLVPCRRRAVAAVAAVCGLLLFAASSSAAVRSHPVSPPNHKVGHGVSSNWSGYAVSGGSYTTVSASWTQPAVDCSITPTGWSSFWVGLDGDTSDTVEQTGTEADCSNGQPVYSAWSEMYPKYPKTSRNPVSPGDSLSASVTTDQRGTFTLTLRDTTKGWTEQSTQRLKRAQLASAEVIAEAPSSSGGVLPLADFGTVGFSGATVDGGLLTRSTPGIDPITMVSGTTVKAQPSAISNGSFSVRWRHS